MGFVTMLSRFIHICVFVKYNYANVEVSDNKMLPIPTPPLVFHSRNRAILARDCKIRKQGKWKSGLCVLYYYYTVIQQMETSVPNSLTNSVTIPVKIIAK